MVFIFLCQILSSSLLRFCIFTFLFFTPHGTPSPPPFHVSFSNPFVSLISVINLRRNFWLNLTLQRLRHTLTHMQHMSICSYPYFVLCSSEPTGKVTFALRVNKVTTTFGVAVRLKKRRIKRYRAEKWGVKFDNNLLFLTWNIGSNVFQICWI